MIALFYFVGSENPCIYSVPNRKQSYDVCFNSWPLAPNNYNTDDFKHWYAQAETALGDQNILFAFWCNEHRNDIDAFVEQFISLFNLLAERNDVDALPPVNSPPENQEGGNNPEE